MINMLALLCYLPIIITNDFAGKQTLNMGGFVFDMAISKDSTKVYISESGTNTILVYKNNGEEFQYFHTVQFPNLVQYFQASPSGQFLVANDPSAGLYIVETKNFTEVQHLVSSGQGRIIFSQDEKVILVCRPLQIKIFQKKQTGFSLSDIILVENNTYLAASLTPNHRLLTFPSFIKQEVYIYELIAGSYIKKQTILNKKGVSFLKITEQELILSQQTSIQLYKNNGTYFQVYNLTLISPIFPVSCNQNGTLLYGWSNSKIYEIYHNQNGFQSQVIADQIIFGITSFTSSHGLYTGFGDMTGLVQIFYKCPLECKTCIFPNNCTKCQKDYILQSGMCVPVPSHCVKNQFLADNICEQYCAKKCKTCNETRRDCFECAENYERGEGGKCVLKNNVINLFAKIRIILNIGRRNNIKFIFYLLDDLWLYQYHKTNYKGVMKKIFQTIRFIEDKQWQIIDLEEVKDAVQNSLPGVNKYNSYSNEKYMCLERRNNFFLQNLMTFLTFFLPITIIVVFLARRIFFILFNYQISKILRPYSFWLILLQLLLINNLQYFWFLGFRFWQIAFFFDFESMLMTCLSFLLLLIVCFATFGGYLTFYFQYQKLGKYFLVNMNNKTSSYVLMTLLYGFKPFLKGATHSMFYEQGKVQLQLLIAIQVIFLLLTFGFQFYLNNYKSIVVFMFQSMCYGCLILLNITLLLQYFDSNFQTQSCQDILQASCETLIWMMIGFAFMRTIWEWMSSLCQCFKKYEEQEQEFHSKNSLVQDSPFVQEQQPLPVAPLPSPRQQTCVLCEVLGCEFCQSGKQNICIKCSDCSAYLHEGKCACKEGYVMNSQGECIRRACLYPSVVENGVCKCPASFVQIGQSCRNCSEYGCVKCSSLDQINVKCETCEEGKGLEDGACVACGYGAKKYGEVCVQCLVQGCAFCALDNVCEQCLPGWVSKQNICVECPPGQYEAHGICSSCHPNCAQCRKYASSCTACAQGKYLFASACISCKHGCSYCSPLNPTICLACADGYFLDRNLCYQCPKGCSTCSSDYNCSSCAAPYVLSGISCVIPCVFPCWTCQQDTPTSCLSCFDGYKLESSSCVLDVSCNDTSTCTGCSPTYYLTQEGKCQSCPQHCRTCPNQVCSQCVEGFDLFAQECVKEGSYSFKGNEQLSKQINTNPRLKRKFQQILKSK